MTMLSHMAAECRSESTRYIIIIIYHH